MLIFSSLQSSGNATLQQNVRGKRAKNEEEKKNPCNIHNVCKYLQVHYM
jgi:hypothetical protein